MKKVNRNNIGNDKVFQPTASIIIPAYNEGKVIKQCLDLLLREANPGEFDIVVVCNGCTDNTETIAREYGAAVRVFSTDRPSKPAALNLGDKVAFTYPRVYLDSDLEVSTRAVRSLIKGLESSKYAAIGYMDVDLRDRSWLISSFYKLWMLHPYLRDGKFGGVYALSQKGCKRRGPYPDLMGDDAFARNSFSPDQSVAVPSCRFLIFPPRTMMDLLRVRTRIYLGNYQLQGFENHTTQASNNVVASWLKAVVCSPLAWPGIPVYVLLNLIAKLNASRLHRKLSYQWLRDDSSRSRAF